MTDVPTRADLDGLAKTADRAHWADGYAWADQPSSMSYTPWFDYSFNRTGGAIVITRPSGTTGRYNVRFTGLSAFLGDKSTVHVTSFGPGDIYCKPTTPTLVNDVLQVRCYDASSGAAVNTSFTVFVTGNYTDNAFAHAHQPTGTSYVPQANGSWNPGSTIRVTRSGTGTYSVLFTGLGALAQAAANGGHVQVVAVGTDLAHCKVTYWAGSPQLNASVRCFTRTGVPKDTKFNVLFQLPSPHLGYAWASDPTNAGYYANTFYGHNAWGGSTFIRRAGVGSYTVEFYGLQNALLDGGNVQVTAYGGGSAQCKVEAWAFSSVAVLCFAPDGTPVDSYFTLFLGS